MPTYYQGTKRDIRALNSYINLVRASETVLDRFGADLALKGLTLGQFGALEALLHLGPMCQRDLGEKLLRSGGNVTLVVDNLERHGWVRRERQKKDRRKILIRLTAGGRRLIEWVFPLHLKAVVKEFSRLTQTEQETLRRLCRKLGRGGEKSRGDKTESRKPKLTITDFE
jgi:MarR family 2-MHQ and catechol resistance regulon transcriptional repressor